MLSSQTIFVLQGHVEMQEKCDNLTITSTYPEVFFYSISVSTFYFIFSLQSVISNKKKK
jgi:hypothetical protein